MAWSATLKASLLAASALFLALPAWAQGTVGHASTYTLTLPDLLTVRRAAQGVLPLADSATLPRAALLRHNTRPAGLGAPVPGGSQGSANGSADGGAPAAHDDAAAPDAYGNASDQSIAPYSTARASASVLGNAVTIASEVGVTSSPWRSTGALYFKIGKASKICSASLIKPGVLITAAHCVFEYGTNNASGWHTDFLFVPAQHDGSAAAPYGQWTALSERIPTVYFAGADYCYQRGVVCNNDIATITLKADADKRLPGTTTGWYGYGWNGYSYVDSFGGASLASITQLGYPVAFDHGQMMERNDGVGSYWAPGTLRNTLLGSAMTGGSSGGPWLVNFGAVPKVDTANASLGNSAASNRVVGVTSWGSTTVGNNTQGASWFGVNAEYTGASYKDSHNVARGAGNIGKLMADTCTASFDHC